MAERKSRKSKQDGAARKDTLPQVDWEFVERCLATQAIRTVYFHGPPGLGKTFAAYTKGRIASAPYAVTLTESIAAMKQVTAATVPRLLPYLEAGLAPGASSEQFAGAIIVSVQLALKAQLAQPLTEALMEGLAKGARAPLHAQVLQALLVLCQVRSIHLSLIHI